LDASYLTTYECEQLAKRLRAHGYVVIPRERHVVLHSSFIVTRREVAKAPDRIADMALADNMRCLIRKAHHDGLLQHVRRDVEEPVTGCETVFSTMMGIIKPKENNERS